VQRRENLSEYFEEPEMGNEGKKREKKAGAVIGVSERKGGTGW